MSRIPLLLAAVLLLGSCRSPEAISPQNVVLFIADGCGPATYTLGREHVSATENRALAFDAYEVGSVNTRSSHQRVTDSASSATAYACGIRTRNGMIAMSPDSAQVETVLEAAERAGKWTGLVSTTRITHATPAAFSAHVESRNQEEDIALQQLAQGIEVLLGGGATYFAGPDGPTSRSDGRDLFDEASSQGYAVVNDREALLTAQTVPVLGLFDPTHMDYEIDRTDQPSLAEMTRRALELLAEAPEGFFLMIEAGRIDHAGHANDIGAHLHDFLAYEEAFAAAVEFAARDGETLIVATSDHETGGLSLGVDGVYDYRPDIAAAMSMSHERAVDAAAEAAAGGVRGRGLAGLLEALMNENELGQPGEGAMADLAGGVSTAVDPVIYARSAFDGVLRASTAEAAGVGWSTSGHTAVNVPLYAFGPGRGAFVATLDNDELGRRLRVVMGL